VALVRGRDLVHARERLTASLSRFGVAADTVQRIDVEHGDLESFEPPTNVTHVLHAAANTSFKSTPSVWRTNVEGTAKLAERCSRLRSLQRFLYVGTAYRAGVLDARVVAEETPASDQHVVEYTRSKAAAEARLLGLRLPLVIARPSIVIGHTELGVSPS